MEHINAGETRAVERYLLGEMDTLEVDEFEEHIFSCSECADAVRTGAAFADNARAVFREHPTLGTARLDLRSTVSTAWWKRLSFPVLAPAFAALLFFCVAGYQRVLISGLRGQLAETRGAQALPRETLPSTVRGSEEEVVRFPASASVISLSFDVATDSGSGYVCEIRSVSGPVGTPFPIEVSKSGEASILLQRSQFPAGSYTLVVRTGGQESRELDRHSFRLEYQ